MARDTTVEDMCEFYTHMECDMERIARRHKYPGGDAAGNAHGFTTGLADKLAKDIGPNIDGAPDVSESDTPVQASSTAPGYNAPDFATPEFVAACQLFYGYSTQLAEGRLTCQQWYENLKNPTYGMKRCQHDKYNGTGASVILR